MVTQTTAGSSEGGDNILRTSGIVISFPFERITPVAEEKVGSRCKGRNREQPEATTAIQGKIGSGVTRVGTVGTVSTPPWLPYIIPSFSLLYLFPIFVSICFPSFFFWNIISLHKFPGAGVSNPRK